MRWRLRLVSLVLALALAGGACSREQATPESEPPGDARLEQEIERLQALGYVGASERAGDAANVTRHDRSRASPGTNFYTSGHDSEAILMDMDGRVLHRWHHDFEHLVQRRGTIDPVDANPVATAGRRHWRRAHLYPNGDLLAVHDQFALIKLDRDSNLLWVYPERVHHDLEVRPDGRIYVLVAESRRLPRINAAEDVAEDFVAVLDPDGRELRRVSLLECIENAGLEELLEILPDDGDLLHTNALRVLDRGFAERLPAFRDGNVLLSFLTLSTIAVVDLEAEQVVWTLRGDFRFQHDPRLLESGRLLLFDNLGPALRGVPMQRRRGWARQLWYNFIFDVERPVRPASAVLEIEPASGEVVWSYQGRPGAPFRSASLGAAHRLPNGNTLIVESVPGRAFEITPAGEIVWEFVSPHRVGELVGRIFDLVRLPPDFPIGWAADPGTPRAATRSPPSP